MTTVGHLLAGTAVFIACRRGPAAPLGFSGGDGRAQAALLIACLVCANLPDMDLLAGALSGRYLHRGATHSIMFCLFSALAAFAALAARFGALRTFRVFCVCLLAAQSHIFIDYLSDDTLAPFGIPPFWPFSDAYYISPAVFFPIALRGSWELVFSVHNLVTFLVEVGYGTVFCLCALLLRKVRP